MTLRLGPGAPVLRGVDWEVGPHERWVVVGPNGSGKTSLLRLAGAWLHPTSGTVEILGERLGRVDVRVLRRRIGTMGGPLELLLRPETTAEDVVVSARHAALETWWHDYTQDDRDRARRLLDAVACGHLAGRALSTASDGERKRVQLARTLMVAPDLLLLDEPAAGLDLRGREELVERLESLADDPGGPATVLVTHHLEEVPPGFTHALVLADGAVVAAGPVEDALTGPVLSAAFGIDVVVERPGGRWTAFRR